MIIAQNSIDIDENAKLANDAYDYANEVNGNANNAYNHASEAYQKALDSYSHSQGILDELNRQKNHIQQIFDNKISKSPNPPNGTANHQNGDLWFQTNNGSVISMFTYQNGGWQENKWDTLALSVKDLSALNANLGNVKSGTLDGVSINSSEINVDIDGGGLAYDSGFNPVKWTTGGKYQNDQWVDWNNDAERNNAFLGFHLKHGLMSFRGFRTQTPDGTDGTVDSTYIAPNDIKLRNSNDLTTSNGSITGRVDIRSNYIEIGEKYGTPSIFGGTVGNGLYSDGTAVISKRLYTSAITTNSITNQNNAEVSFPKGIDANYIGNYTSGSRVFVNASLETSWSLYAGRSIFAKGVKVASDYSKKNVSDNFTSKKALSEVLGTDIYRYHYKGDNSELEIGPVIDNVNDIKSSKFNISEYMVNRNDDNNNYFSMKNAVGLLIGSVQELSKQNENLLQKITKLEANK